MEKFARRENVLLGYNPQTSSEDSPKSQNTNSDMDFSDVFGGPPRRFSLHEVRTRYSFNETLESEDDEAVSPRSPWSGFDEKPVFGAEIGNRRQFHHPSDDFFVDIFGGDESRPYSSPRMNSRDHFGSNPGSRILSPTKPLPPQAEPFSSSLPTQFGLPSKLTKAMESPVFASANRNLYKNKDANSNGVNTLSRFSSEASELMEEMRKGSSFRHQSPITHEVSRSNEEAASETISDIINNKDDKLMNDSESLEGPSSKQFHFSIYKWAGKGVPLLMPLLVGNRLRSKERSKLERCNSTNGRIQFERNMEEHNLPVNDESILTEIKDEKPEGSVKEANMESHNTVRKKQPDILEPKCHETSACAIPFDEAILSKKSVEEPISFHEVDSCKNPENEVYVQKEQGSKPELKPLSSFLDDNARGEAGEDCAVKIAKLVHTNANASTSVKQASAKRTGTNQAEVTSDKESHSTSLKESSAKTGTKGKVREFVKILNQETSTKSKGNLDVPNQSSRWKDIDVNGKKNEMSNVAKKDEKVSVQNKRRTPDISFKDEFDTNTEKVKQDSCSKRSSDKNCSRVTNEKHASVFADLFSDYPEIKPENRSDSFQGHFVVEELSHDPDKDLKTVGGSADIKALDAKIQQWSNERKGNIRSLLSTLQFVLWPGSGWKPVPLVNIIEASAVKRAYQKALLCLHPDKLQQKGAGSDQKYIAEKAFDILQEAWDHFNSLGAI